MSGYYNPVASSWNVSSPYLGGFRSSGGHSGVDIAAPAGTPIKAAAPGRVISAGWGGAYGILIKVRHYDGSVGYYAHAQARAVKPGDRVNRGSLIGYVGNTGNVRGRNGGYHLHFEVRQNGKVTNPMPWLAKNYAGGGQGNERLEPGYYDGVSLDAEQLRNAQTIMSVGRSMGASDRDLVIGLMAAMQESHLYNLDYGDRDSLGLFQQRPSQGWGSSSQVRNPTYAARKFFEELLRVKGRHNMRLTEAAQAVQRSAFPERYAQWEELARSIMSNPNASSFHVGGYDTYWQNRLVETRDPFEAMSGFLEFDDQFRLRSSPESPADSPLSSVASSPDGGVTSGPFELDLAFGDFGGTVPVDEGEAVPLPADPSAPAPEPVPLPAISPDDASEDDGASQTRHLLRMV